MIDNLWIWYIIISDGILTILRGDVVNIRHYAPEDDLRLLTLWNDAGASLGYVSLDLEGFRSLVTGNPYFMPDLAFVMETDGNVAGFACGCMGDDIPHGAETGYITCVLLRKDVFSGENLQMLVGKLEDVFRSAGKRCSSISFFNPMRLPWVIPGTAGHQHNNMPGVPVDHAVYEHMLDMGYRETSREHGFYLDLQKFSFPEKMRIKEAAMAEKDYTVARYDPQKHSGIEEMTQALGNPVWCQVIPEAGRQGKNLLVGLKGNTVAGFAGPIYPEPTGRGYMDGIGVAPAFEGNGLGKLLFYRLLQEEKLCGADYMSIFTGAENPARFIYMEAGFELRREFAVMRKEL